MEIKKIMNDLVNAEKIMDQLDVMYEENPESETIEKSWNKQYKVVYDLHSRLEDEIVKITAGKVDKRTAHAMVGGKRAELQALIARLA